MGRVCTIPAEQPFVDALAAGLLDAAGGGPEALTGTLVLLPTRRACRSLVEAFLRRAEAGALLLPQIQPIGEVDADELLLAGELEPDVLPPIEPLRRRLLLARLLGRAVPRLEHALRLAAELEHLLDELQTEGIPLEAIEGIVPEDLAQHWQRNREVLRLLAETWPLIVEAEGAMEPAARRDRLLGALARRWREVPPARPVVAAGSTGSIPATRALLQTIAAMPGGTVVLPGLDRALDEASWAALDPHHPQWGLKQLLLALGRRREEVDSWAAPGVGPGCPARARLLAEVMRPAATIARWQQLEPPAPEALAGLAVETHPDLAAEALAIALRMRAALEVPGRTAALVTPDRHLARRVAAELQRWRIEVDDSAGTPLDQTPPGAFLLLTAHLVADGVTPVSLLAALRHPLARLGREAPALRRAVRELELACLRGPRLAGGFAAVMDELSRAMRRAEERDDEGRRERLAALRRLVDALADHARPFAELMGADEVAITRLVEAHVRFAEALAADAHGRPGPLWAREAGEAAAELIAGLIEAGADGHRIPPRAYPALLALLMQARPVRPRAPRHPRLFIWGELEARLQHADLILLGGLNEGTWPHAVDPGPWLSRAMRAQLGLTPVERRIGLAAHDVTQLAAAGEVVLTRAEKDAGGSPTVPSRWLVRLETVLGIGGEAVVRETADPAWRQWAAALDATRVPRPWPQPRPAPPLAARPRELSVSDIGLWMRDPYALYARRILKLRPLDPLDADPGALARGRLIHAALDRFLKAFPVGLPPDPLPRLLTFGREVFAEVVHRPQVRALWWPRFERVARWIVAEETRRRGAIARILAEIEGRLELEAPAGPFVLTARADRIEQQRDGRLVVVDYKTGSAPKGRDVKSGRQPQLPLEGAIAEAGGYHGLAPGEVAELAYWVLKDEGEARPPVAEAPADLIRDALAGLGRLIAHYDDPATPYPARWAAPQERARGDYAHLARAEEWPG